MQYKVFETGVPLLDEMLGGGIIQDGVVLIVYNTGSYGWALGVEIFRSFVEKGWFGLVTNYSFPYGLLSKYAYALHFDMSGLGKNGSLAVLDVFGSVNGVESKEPFVHSIGRIDGNTFLPKIVSLYLKVIGDRKRRIGISITLDGFVSIFGEETGMKILQKNMALKDSTPRNPDESVLNIFLLNQERVSPRFIAWLSQYSEHIIEFQPTGRPGVEKLVVKKSLLPDFEPSVGLFKFSRGRIKLSRITAIE